MLKLVSNIYPIVNFLCSQFSLWKASSSIVKQCTNIVLSWDLTQDARENLEETNLYANFKNNTTHLGPLG